MGFSEELVSKAIKGIRDKVVIATKCGMRWNSDEGSDPWEQKDNQGNPVTIRRNAKQASIAYECEQSLKRLGVDIMAICIRSTGPTRRRRLKIQSRRW